MSYVGVQRQIDSSLFGVADYSIADGANVKFNTNLGYFGGTDEIISYDPTNGVFTFTKAGYYYIDWFIVLMSAFSTSGPTFSLVVTTGTTKLVYSSTSSFKTGTLSGSAIVPAEVNTTMSIRNDTGGVTILANNILDTNGFGIVGNISIIRYLQDISGIEVGLTGATEIANGGIVPYNQTISTITSPEITNTAGVFTVHQAGIYLFDWTVSIAGMNGIAKEIIFELKRDATTVVGKSVSPVVNQGYITGTAIASATVDQTFSLYNSTFNTDTTPAGITITYQNLSTQASMRIFTIV